MNSEFNLYELKYLQRIEQKYNINNAVGREIILYSKRINNGLMLYWFLDRVTEYIYRHNAKSSESAKTLLNTFHEKYVVTFGR